MRKVQKNVFRSIKYCEKTILNSYGYVVAGKPHAALMGFRIANRHLNRIRRALQRRGVFAKVKGRK